MNQKINGKRAQKLVEKGAVLIDMRDAVAFRDGTLPGAINLSLRRIAELNKHPKNTNIILFGSADGDETLMFAINYVKQFGFERVYSLGAKENWNK